MITRSTSKKQIEIKKEVLTPQKQQTEIMSETNTPAMRNEEIKQEKFQSPVFNIHIHMPPANGNVPMPPIPSIQPVIHLHFVDAMKKMDSEGNSSMKSSINNSIKKNLLNFLSMASPNTVNVTAEFDESSNSYSVLENSLENDNRNAENDQSETVLKYNCELNNRSSRKKVQSSKALIKANKLKGLIQTKNNTKKNLNTRQNNRDFKSVMPSLEKKINSLVKNHLQISICSSDESDRECNNKVGNSVKANCNLFSSSVDYENIYKLKKAVVKLKDIYSKTNYRLASSDDHSKVKTNSSCSVLNSSNEIVSRGVNECGQGRYFLRMKTTPLKNSVTGHTLEMKQRNIVTDEVNRTLQKNCDRENTNKISSKNKVIGNTNSPPEKNIDAEKANRTPQKNIDLENRNKKSEVISNSEHMESETSPTSKNSSVLDNMNSALKKHNVTKNTGRTSEKSTYTEGTVNDTNGTSQKNSVTNHTEVIERKKGINSDSDNSESGESDTEEGVKIIKKVERAEKSGEISNSDSYLDSESSGSGSDDTIEIINCSKKFNLLEETPKPSLISNRTEIKLDKTTKRTFNLNVTSSESEGSDADVSKECEGDSSENAALLSLGKNNGGVYHTVYKSDNEQEQPPDKTNLTLLMEGCNFSEILKKIKDKSLREKIIDLAERQRVTTETEHWEPGSGQKVQQEQECIPEKRNKSECSMLGSESSCKKSGKEREEEEKENESLDDETQDEETSRSSFTNEDDKSTVEYDANDASCTLNGAIEDKDSFRDGPDLRDYCKKVLFEYPENELFDEHSETDKNNKEIHVKDFSLGEETGVGDERDEVDVVGEKINALHKGQSRKSEEKESLDFNQFKLECIKKEMLRRGLGIKSGKKNKRKPERKSKKKKPQNRDSPPLETSSSPQKKMKLSEDKPSSSKSKKAFSSEENYIRLETSGPTKFAVAPLDKLKPYQKHKAMDFKKKMLFGDRVRRFSSTKELEMYKMKQKAGGKLS